MNHFHPAHEQVPRSTAFATHRWTKRRLLPLVAGIAGAAMCHLAEGQFDPWVETAKLTAFDGSERDQFALSVAVGESFAVAGAWLDDDLGRDSGAAYVFDATTGSQLWKLLPDDGRDFWAFGYSVDLLGSQAIIGAHGDTTNGILSGAAYLYDLNTGVQQGKLIPNDGAERDYFGLAVGINDRVAVVGAYLDDDSQFDSGSVYIFDLADGTQQFKIPSPNGGFQDYFGTSIDVDGDLAVVGAPQADIGRGLAYVIDTVTGSVRLQLEAPNAADDDEFGTDVAISDALVLVGGPNRDILGTNAGAAYLFDLATGQQLFEITVRDAARADRFGSAVALGDTVAMVGAPFDDDFGTDSGSVYVVDLISGLPLQKLNGSDTAGDDRFGSAIALSGPRAVVGSLLNDELGSDAGGAYLFRGDLSEMIFDVEGTCPGPMEGVLRGATPGGEVVFVYGFGNALRIPSGQPCAGTRLNVGGPRLGTLRGFADASGTVRLGRNAPPLACGQVSVQAVDLASCRVSNVVAIP